MFSDRNFPPTFLAGNKSLRDMSKDPDEYDRRMSNFENRQLEQQKTRETRDAQMKRIAEERAKYTYQPTSALPRNIISNSSMTTQDMTSYGRPAASESHSGQQ
jgi:hypothetical protein